jgi:hypothetical protein
MNSRNVTGEREVANLAERYQLWRLCDGERQLVATCATPEALGVALVTLGREGEFSECPIGVLDTMGEVGQKWIVRPWLPFPTPKNLSDAGRTLQTARKGKT